MELARTIAGIGLVCFLIVLFAIGQNALTATKRRHPEQHEHVPGEWL